MLYYIKALYYTCFLPPGIFIVALLFCAWRLRNNRRTVKWCVGLAATLYICSTYWFASVLVQPLEKAYQPPSQLHGDVVLMLGGGATVDTPNLGGVGHLSGNAANRLVTTAQLARAASLPIIVSGGKVFDTSGSEGEIAARILADLGVAPERITIDSRSLNTQQNIFYSQEIMRQKGYRKALLVTSAFHMPRAMAECRAMGLEAIPYPTDYQVSLKRSLDFYQFWPSADALEIVSLAMKEYLGLAVLLIR